MDKPVCEVCGAPANQAVRDFFSNDNWDTGVKEFIPNGGHHYYCHEHRRESVTTNITVSPLTHYYNKVNQSKTQTD